MMIDKYIPVSLGFVLDQSPSAVEAIERGLSEGIVGLYVKLKGVVTVRRDRPQIGEDGRVVLAPIDHTYDCKSADYFQIFDDDALALVDGRTIVVHKFSRLRMAQNLIDVEAGVGGYLFVEPRRPVSLGLHDAFVSKVDYDNWIEPYMKLNGPYRSKPKAKDGRHSKVSVLRERVHVAVLDILKNKLSSVLDTRGHIVKERIADKIVEDGYDGSDSTSLSKYLGPSKGKHIAIIIDIAASVLSLDENMMRKGENLDDYAARMRPQILDALAPENIADLK